MLYCKICGTPAEPNAKFCVGCCNRLDGTNVIRTADEYEMASAKRYSDDFDPDAYVMHNNLSGEIVNGFRLIELVCSVAGSDYYSAARSEAESHENRTVQHFLLPEHQSRGAMLIAGGLDPSMADKALKECVYSVTEEIQSFIGLCKRAGIACIYEGSELRFSEMFGAYHVFIFMKPVMPLWEYISKTPVTLRQVIDMGISLCDQLLAIERLGETYRAMNDANVFVDESGGVFLGSGLPDAFAENMYLDAYTQFGNMYKRPDDFPVKQEVYGLGMLLYVLLNRMRHPYINQYQEKIGMSVFSEAEKKRAAHLPTRPPVFSENSLGKALLRTFSNVDEHVISLSEFSRILSSSLNYITSEELNREVLDIYTKKS